MISQLLYYSLIALLMRCQRFGRWMDRVLRGMFGIGGDVVSGFTLASVVIANVIGGCSSRLSGAQIDDHFSQPFDKKSAAQARINLGVCYLAHGQLPMARQNIERALRYQPESYRTQLAMALYQQQMGENGNAQRYYQRALQLAPRAGELLNNYGVFLCMQQRYTEAQHYFNAAIQAPGYAHLADSLQNSGLCYLQAEQPQLAQRLLQRALKHQPSSGAHWLVLATSAFNQSRQQHANWLLEIYEQLLPVSAESLWLRLQFSARAGELAAVEHYGAQLARDFPHSPRYQQYLAHDYQK